MSELLGLGLASGAAFAATNVDDLLVLAALFGIARAGGQGLRGRQIVVGQYVGLGALVSLSALAAFGLLSLPAELVGLLGLIPLGLGIRGLVLARGTVGEARMETLVPSHAGAVGVAGLTIANGADNLAVYVPFFAAAGATGMAVVAVVFAGQVAVWCAAGRLLGGHPATVAAIRRFGHVAVPCVFIALGLLILGEAGVPGATWKLL